MNISSCIRLAKLHFAYNKYNIYVMTNIMQSVTQLNYNQVSVFNEIVLKKQQIQSFFIKIQRYKQGEPLGYITGTQDFWSLQLHVHPEVFIPRDDTEYLVQEVLLKLEKNFKVIDLGTGTGAIAITLASIRKDCFFLGIDISNKSLDLAKLNA